MDQNQDGRNWGTTGPAIPKRISTKGFIMKFMLSKRDFNEKVHALGEISTKGFMPSKRDFNY